MGGVKGEEVYGDTLESKLVPGLFFAGEVLDVDGKCGGWNLQWAWSSGWTAENMRPLFPARWEIKALDKRKEGIGIWRLRKVTFKCIRETEKESDGGAGDCAQKSLCRKQSLFRTVYEGAGLQRTQSSAIL